ncbi:MAG: hypothetical protein ACKVT2_12730 [Saprospiraceae bacterium]
MSHFNAEAKKSIRSVWCKSLIRFLSEALQAKLTYLGLPSEHPEDIHEWIEYLDTVYAFQCRLYPEPSSDEQSRERVLELESKLRTLERQNKLSTFTVFDGYLEEVILRGKDNNPQPIQFGHEQAITIYNLDFCNQIDSPRKIVVNGKTRTVFKFDVINELLRYQSQVDQLPKKFLLFLTVHSDFNDESVMPLVIGKLKDYNLKLSQAKLKGKERKSRVLKAYIYEILRNAFEIYHFIPEFLPTIRYKGTGDQGMLFFTVIGTFLKPHPGGVLTLQKPEVFLNQSFLNVTDKQEFITTLLQSFEETRPRADAIEAFCKSQTYKKHWINKVSK